MAKNKTYAVVKGDTLSEIAQRFNVSVNDIVKANSNLIKNKNVIQIGWVLTIPVSEPSESKPTTSKEYGEIGKQFETALRDVRNLDSVKKLMKLLEG